MAIHFNRQTIFYFTHIEGITLDASEKIGKAAGGASGRCVNRIGEVGDRTSGGQADGVYRAGFTASSLERIGANIFKLQKF